MKRVDILDAMAADVFEKDGAKAESFIRAVLNEKARIQRSKDVRVEAQKATFQAAHALNSLTDDFFAKSPKERLKELNRKTALDRLFAEAFANGSYESNMRTLIKLAKSFGPVDVVTIQSAARLDHKTQAEIMKDFNGKESRILYFQTRPNLLGGMRVFHRGAMTDRSVSGRITQLFHSI